MRSMLTSALWYSLKAAHPNSEKIDALTQRIYLNSFEHKFFDSIELLEIWGANVLIDQTWPLTNFHYECNISHKTFP